MSIQPPASNDPTTLVAPTGAISAAAPMPGEAPQSPPPTRALLPGILATALTLFATYGGLIAILLPTQIALLDEQNKVANLAIVSTVSFVFTLFAQPIVGAFSDRTRSRFGRRTPWMVGGALIGGVFLLGLGSLTSLVWIAVFWVIIQVSLNALQGPLSALTPDRFPREKRGAASAMFGIGSQIGMTVGIMLAGALAANIGVGYSAFGIAVIVVTLLFVLVNRDWSSKEAAVPTWSWKQFFAGFWINPRKHPDFAWAFAARFLLVLGYFVVTAFQLYILTDYIGMPLGEAQGAVVTLTLVAFVPTLIAIGLSGWWSDRIGRRKVFIYAASVIMVAGLAAPLLMPNMTGMIVMSIINGVGFGLYMSVDAALMTEVLPGGGAAAGKDLGILNVATNIPQALSPAIAGVIIASFGGYPVLFVFGIVAVIAAALVLIPIKSVR
ncbi:MFS transporter [Agromyces subbeticus]|uniref:MFS transporter n=1 Tax=Agromyces subbeticus TaxID=293890 RepID=UPI0003B5105F|nr:MFS transporter [Agromyces subbeticus]